MSYYNRTIVVERDSRELTARVIGMIDAFPAIEAGVATAEAAAVTAAEAATEAAASARSHSQRTIAAAEALIGVLSEGEVGWMEALPYRKNSAKTGTASATYDLGVSGLEPAFRWSPKHFGASGGAVDDSPAWQRMFDAAPSNGVSIVVDDNYVLGSTVHKKLNAGGALGWGWSIIGDGRTTHTITHATGDNEPAIYLEGPTGTFTSGIEIRGFRMAAAVPGQGIGIRLTGAARCDGEITFRNLYRGMQVESVLICDMHVRASYCTVGIHFLKYGTLGGDWGQSGNNENIIRGDFGQCQQYAMIYDTCRPGTFIGHIERCGNENIAGGGVSDLDRGGIKLIDPIGTFRWIGSSEDCGDREDGQDGQGALRVLTTGAHDDEWSVVLDGVSIHGTLDRPTSYVNVFQAATAGNGRLVFNGGGFYDSPDYAGNPANSYLNLQADGRNLDVVMNGWSMKFGATEFSDSLNPDVTYHLTGMPESTPGGAHSFTKSSRPNEPLMRLFSGGDTAGTAEAQIGSRISVNGGTVGRLSFFGDNSAGNEQVYARLNGIIGNGAAGSETGQGLSVETLNASGGFDTEWRWGRDGMASFGAVLRGRGTINALGGYYIGAVSETTGSGSPEGVVIAPPGSRYYNTNGGAGTTLYVKETGTGNTGWAAK